MSRLRHPIRATREPFGTAGLLVAVIALVLALTGAAFAAAGLNGKQKKEVEKIAKKFAGKPGKNGTNGTNGAPGAKGDAGAAGPEGKQGPEGKEGPEGPQGKQGKEGKEGKEGSPWTAGGVLPSGKTETGTVAYRADLTAGQTLPVSISFPIPLASPLTGTAQVHMVTADGTTEIRENESTELWEEVTPTKCGSALTPAGTAGDPAAAPGNLCVYFTKAVPAVKEHVYVLDPSTTCEAFACAVGFGGPGMGTGVSGARLEVFGATDYTGYGTWAVTAP